MAAILIKNGLVYDGSGGEPVREDVLIRGEKILKRGTFSKSRAEKIIDAMDAIVTPGFIDVNSSADHYLEIFRSDFGGDEIKDGVTTVIGGNCGASLAPATDQSLVSLQKWSAISGFNVDWHDFRGLFKHLEKQGLSVNFGTLVGHDTVRRAILGDKMRDLTDNEMRTALKIVSSAFKSGVLGLSTGLGFVDAELAPVREIEQLVQIVSEEGRVYATHLRDYDSRVSRALDEAIRIAKKTGVNLEISHFMPTVSNAREYLSLKKKIEEESAKTRINFDCNTSSYISTPIYQLLPERLKKGSLEEMNERLNNEHLEKEILGHLRKFAGENIRFGETPAHLNFLYGKSLIDYAIDNKLGPVESLLKLMKSSGLRGVILRGAVERSLIDDFVFSSNSLIASGETKDRGVFLKFLKLAEKMDFFLEKAVAKLTASPADKYGLKLRGGIKEGYFADVLVIKDNTVKDAVVNGRITLEDGEFLNPHSGKILKYAR